MKIWRVRLTLPHYEFIENYRKSSEDDKASVNGLILVLILIISILFAIEYTNIRGGALYVINAVLFSVLVSTLFSLLDRVGVLLPIVHENAKQAEALKAASDTLAGFSKYRIARYEYGFNAIRGHEEGIDPSALFSNFGENQFILDIISKSQRGTQISIMNSFFEHDAMYEEVIRKAIYRGVDFRMLLMRPEKSSPVVLARFKEYFESEPPELSNIERFIERIRPKYHKFDDLRRRIRTISEMAESLKNGNFEIRYYTESLGFPMTMVTIDQNITKVPDVVYTGFYTGISSEKMPYVEWRGGSFRIIDQFNALFNRKWNDCASNTFIFPENAPLDFTI